MRNMSFMLTTPQMYSGTKKVTRRIGWWNLKPGDVVMAVEKGMGLKKGEKVVQIYQIMIVETRPETLDYMIHDHEQIFLLSKSKNYYYDYKAILEPITDTSVKRLSQNVEGQTGTFRATVGAKSNGPLRAVATKLQTGRTDKKQDATGKATYTGFNERYKRKLEGTGTAGDGTGLKGHSGYYDADGNPRVHQMEDGVFARNKRTVWNVATKPYKEAHFATFPPELIEPCILAGSEKGDIVLDPFSGSGTTGYVAVTHNRRYYGIDLNPEYNKLARKRILSAKPMLFGVERINA